MAAVEKAYSQLVTTHMRLATEEEVATSALRQAAGFMGNELLILSATYM